MARRGNVVIPLSAEMLKIPGRFKPGEVSIGNARSLSLAFESVERRYVPVRAVFRGEMAKDMTFVGQPVIVPDRVLVSGASSALADTAEVVTEEIDLRSRPGTFSREVGLRLGGRRLTVVPRKVLVKFELGKRASRTLAGIPPTVLQADEGLQVECSPRTASVTVEGPEELVKRLLPDEVSIVLDVSARKKGTYRIRPEVIVPQGIERYSLDVEVFEVTVAPKERGGS